MYFYIYLAEFLFIFLSSRILINKFSLFLLALTKNRKITISILALFFLPGTIVHELSHYIASYILFVKAGKITVVPKFADDKVILGSVEIEKTDQVRKFLIGISPIFFGTGLISGISYFVISDFSNFFPPQGFGGIAMYFLISYLLFTVGNTMFSSKKDFEGTLWAIFLLIIAAFLFLSFSDTRNFFIQSIERADHFFRILAFLMLPCVTANTLLVGIYFMAGSFRSQSR